MARRRHRNELIVANIKAFEAEAANFERLLAAFGFTVERLTRHGRLSNHYAVCDKSKAVILEYRPAHRRVIHYTARRTYTAAKVMDVAQAAIEGKPVGEPIHNPQRPDKLTREFFKIAKRL